MPGDNSEVVDSERRRAQARGGRCPGNVNRKGQMTFAVAREAMEHSARILINAHHLIQIVDGDGLREGGPGYCKNGELAVVADEPTGEKGRASSLNDADEVGYIIVDSKHHSIEI